MNCKHHPNTQSIGECRLCGTKVCQECMKVVKGSVLCPECIAAVSGTAQKTHDSEQETLKNDFQPQQEMNMNKPVVGDKSKFFTFILSFLPGLGHLYLGLTRQGIELMVLFFGVAWLTSIFGGLPFAFIFPILFFYGIFDALQKRDRMARGIAIDPDTTFFKDVNFEWFTDKKWIGWTVVILGGLLLLKQMGVYRYFFGFNDVAVAVLLIGAGVWMLQKQRGSGDKAGRDKREYHGEEPPNA